MNLTHFFSKLIGNVVIKNDSPVNIRLSPKHQTSEISPKTSDVTTSEVATLSST